MDTYIRARTSDAQQQAACLPRRCMAHGLILKAAAAADYKEAEWMDKQIVWEDNTLSTLGLVLAADYFAESESPGEVVNVIHSGSAARSGQGRVAHLRT